MLQAMFTGIVQCVGEVRERTPEPSGARLVVEASGLPGNLAHGESISVSGCCLTLVEAKSAGANGQRMAFDVVPQTLRLTTLGSLQSGSRVNLERAATPSTLLGGHIVQGHVDGVGEIAQVTTSGGEHRVRIAPPRELMRYIVDKGSVAIDGVSLTVAAAGDENFDVVLIPTTLAHTTLGELKPGSRVNIEADALAKMVERLIAHRAP